MAFADITEATGLMSSRITEHLPIVLFGTTILQEETIIPIRGKEDIPVPIVLTTLTILTVHTAGGSGIYFFSLGSENKRKGINKNSIFITGRNVLVDPRTT